MGEKLVLARIPVVIGEGKTQVLSDEQTCLEAPAAKIMDVEAGIRDITSHIIPNKVVVQAVLYKQIYFITEENVVRHQEERLPFTAVIHIPNAQPHMDVHTRLSVEEPIFFRLLNPVVLEQKVVICVLGKVTEERQLYIKAITKKCEHHTNIKDSVLALNQLASAFAGWQVALARGEQEASLKYLESTAVCAKQLADSHLCPVGAELVTRILEEIRQSL